MNFLADKKNWGTEACSPRKNCYIRDQIVASGRFWTPDVPMTILNVILKSILLEAEKLTRVGMQEHDPLEILQL